MKSLASEGMTVAQAHVFAEQIRVTRKVYDGKRAREIAPAQATPAAPVAAASAEPLVKLRELVCAGCGHSVPMRPGAPVPPLKRLACMKCGARGKAYYREKVVPREAAA